MADCLTPDEIEKLLADTLSQQEKSRAEAHLRTCKGCREQFEARRADGQLFAEIKRAYREEDASKRSDPDATRSGAPNSAPRPAVADTIEGYEILSEIHRGGQGVVYKAVQKATKRTVALKVLLEGPYASPRQRHRFEREIDLVASLQHPNIVTVYDSGVTHDDRHYFAMEYIHGQPLNAFLSDKSLSIDETLRLFQKICAAVNYAHQRGVIHRDLKPGNVRIDAEGQPHILDFGLAKTAGTDLTAGAPVTVTGEFMGTLAYASPEQTKGDPTLIDIRTDVYSLGVILYEMLTGKYPYPVVGQMAEVLKNIAEAEPKKPSTIRRRINDEVETIVLKALAKEKERRYQSAGTVADDIDRYLRGEPIEAKRDSRLYVLKKTLAHYKRQALLSGVMLVVVAAAIVTAGYFWDKTREGRDRLVRRRQADDLISKARHLIETRSLLPQAQSYLDEAIRLWPDHEQAYTQRGLLKALFGLEARIEHKMAWVDEAVEDLYEAHRAAGKRGLRSALVTAAPLLLLAGRHGEAEAAARAAEALSSRDDHPNVVHVRIYDVHWDPLIVTDESLSGSPDAARMDPDYDATIRRALSEAVRSLDPLDATRGRQFEIIELLFDRLYRVEVVEAGNPDVRRNRVLVKNVKKSADGLTWHITLQPGCTWHDGRPLTAHDVVFSWKRHGDSDGALRSVEAVADDRLKLVYEELTPTAEWDLVFYLAPRHIYGESPPPGAERPDQRPIGSGPYRWSPDSSEEVVVVERWDAYPGDRPFLKRIEFRVLPQSDKRIRALADGDVDVVNLSGAEFRWAVNGESFRKHVAKLVQPVWSYVYICWNADGSNPFFSDPNVRRAMTHAMNLPRIISQRFGGLYSPCAGIYCRGSWMSNPDVVPLVYHPGRASALLDAAGWTVGEDSGGIRSRNGSRFEFTLLIPEKSAEFESLAYDLQRDLGAVGVLMKIETASFRECRRRVGGGDFEACALRLLTSLHPDQGRVRWETDGSMNYAGYGNPKVDALYDQARRTTDRIRQRACYQEIQKLIYEDQPVTFLWEAPDLLAVNKRLRGLQLSPRGITGCYPGARAWWVPARGD